MGGPGSGRGQRRTTEPPSPVDAASASASDAPSSATEEPKRSKPRAPRTTTGIKIDTTTAQALGKQMADAIAIPYAVMARTKDDPRWNLSDEEKQALASFWSFYIVLRADVFGEWMPEVMLVIVNGAPLGARLMMKPERDANVVPIREAAKGVT